MRTKLFAFFIGAALMACLCNTASEAQMPTVEPTGVTAMSACPANMGFYSDQNNQPTCYTGTLSCPNTASITPTWSITDPGGTQGTIVFFGGGGGESAASFPGEEQVFVPQYTSAGYQVIQVAWPSDWELVNSPTTSYTPNILNAACRIASVLHYAYENYYTNVTGKAGMCAQGASAGGGGLAYALTWYNTASYLDKAVFASSPVFSDVEQGCEVPNNTSVGMCASGAFYCNGWSANQYETAEYTDHATKVEEWTGGTSWTGPATCANSTPPLQTTTYNAQWYNQSIVNFPATGQQPKFNYPQTTMTSWLCEGDDQEGGYNNSGSQGMLYFQQFTNNSQAGGWLQVNGITNCLDTEGVTYGTPPLSWKTLLQNNHLLPTGANAIAFDMTSPLYANNCHKLH